MRISIFFAEFIFAASAQNLIGMPHNKKNSTSVTPRITKIMVEQAPINARPSLHSIDRGTARVQPNHIACILNDYWSKVLVKVGCTFVVQCITSMNKRH